VARHRSRQGERRILDTQSKEFGAATARASNSTKEASTNSKRQVSFQQAWKKIGIWAAGILASVLTATLSPVPHWVIMHWFDSYSGPALTVNVEPMYMSTEEYTQATSDGHLLNLQLKRLMSQKGSVGSLQFLQEVSAMGGVYVDVLKIQLIVSGHSSQGVRILDIRPVSLHRTAPLGGTLFLVPSQGLSPTIPMMFDLDTAYPIARTVKKGPQPTLQSWFDGAIQGTPFFDGDTITLADHEQQMLSIRFQSTKFYVTFDLEIDYTIGNSNGALHKVMVDNKGQPFRVTGMHPGSEPGTASYQEAFMNTGSDSLCKVEK
jgi:hypothetical protein